MQSLYPWVRCIYMQECSVHSLICLLFPWVQCQSLKPVSNQCSQTSFVTVDDFIALYTLWYIFYSHGYNVTSLKPVLSPCNQTGFVTVDDFIALYTLSFVFNSHRCNVFVHARTFFTLADTIAPIFGASTVITEVWPREVKYRDN